MAPVARTASGLGKSQVSLVHVAAALCVSLGLLLRLVGVRFASHLQSATYQAVHVGGKNTPARTALAGRAPRPRAPIPVADMTAASTAANATMEATTEAMV